MSTLHDSFTALSIVDTASQSNDSDKSLVSHEKDMKFHPLFSTPAQEHNIILQSNDDVHFHFSMNVLRQSNFFAGLTSLPTGGSHQPDDAIIELEKADSTTLAMLLSVLGDFDPQLDLTQFMLPVPDLLVDEHMSDLFRVADAYDLLDAICPNLSLYHAHDTPLQFVLACVIGYEIGAVNISKALVNELPLGVRLQSLLASFAPTYLDRWTSFETDRESAWTRCVQKIKEYQPMFNGFNDFGQKCKKGGGCKAYRKSEGDFDKVRAVAARMVISAITNQPWNWSRIGDINEAVRKGIPCHACAFRIEKTFDAAIQDTLLRAPKSI